MKVIFDDGIKAIHDYNLKDAYGHKCYISVLLGSFNGLIGINPEQKKQQNKLDSMGLKHVITQKYLQVIDITEQTYNKINQLYTCNRDSFQIW